MNKYINKCLRTFTNTLAMDKAEPHLHAPVRRHVHKSGVGFALQSLPLKVLFLKVFNQIPIHL